MTIRNLLASTALVTLAATAAYAAPTGAPLTADSYLPAQTAEERMATDLIGKTVYTSAAADADALGDVNNLLLSSDGNIEAVVIGVGGFLGLGEKDVAVTYDSFQWQTDKDGRAWLVLATTKEQLEAAPAFAEVEAVATAPVEPTDQTAMAPAPEAGLTAPAPDTAMAPDAIEPAPAVSETAMAPDAMAPAPADPAMTAETAAPQTFDVSKISADQLINSTVYGPDDTNLGEVNDVILSDSGGIDAVVIDVGGFLGVGEKPVAIAFKDLEVKADENQNLVIHTAFTKEQLEAAPQYDKAAFDANPGQVMVRAAG